MSLARAERQRVVGRVLALAADGTAMSQVPHRRCIELHLGARLCRRRGRVVRSFQSARHHAGYECRSAGADTRSHRLGREALAYDELARADDRRAFMAGARRPLVSCTSSRIAISSGNRQAYSLSRKRGAGAARIAASANDRLDNFDRSRDEMRTHPASGLWTRRRIADAAPALVLPRLFDYADGSEWGVSHYRMTAVN